MMLPRVGDRITVMPYGEGVVNRNIGEARVIVTLARMVRRQDGKFTNQVVAELHPVWCVVGASDG